MLAIGSPFGLAKTVSAGIVSAKNRPLDDGDGNSSQFQRFIQTDAAINPGNSGGPLVDMAGEVIGMNTAIYTQSSGYEGIGFAMPSNTIINVYNMLIGPDHKVVRGSIGITFQGELPAAVGRIYQLQLRRSRQYGRAQRPRRCRRHPARRHHRLRRRQTRQER